MAAAATTVRGRDSKAPHPQVVVITGASSGVGRATALEFGRRGARLGLLARDRDALLDTQREVERMGGVGLALPADVADPAAVEAAAEETERVLGPIDAWINNAAVSVFSPIREMTAEEFRRVTEVTYLGLVHGTLAALRRMLPRDRGAIGQVGSALAYRAIPLQAAYCGAKHAVQGFNESLRCELLHDRSRVRVTLVHLPATNTPHFGWMKTRLPRRPQPVPPIFQPEVAARAIVWAAAHDRRELTVGGPTVLALLVDRLAPGFGDRILARIGYEAQQCDAPVEPGRADNLWQPVAGMHAAHGAFDDRAQTHSFQFWAVTHRGWMLVLVLAAIAVLLVARS
jgi:NAD(P)-dependent dehydrogenase (short-subunit alcohol dehydrogenase family)